jgi:phage terminase large subunit-like protein
LLIRQRKISKRTKEIVKKKITEVAYSLPRQPAIDFYPFFKDTWLLHNPNALVDNWHIKRICERLQIAAYDRMAGKPTNIMIAIPPGSTKSRIVSVAFTPWVWTFWPESCFICSTYESSLAYYLGRRSKTIIRSEYYQKRWPLFFEKDTESVQENSMGGFRFNVGTGGAVTGMHGQFHLMDDLVKEQLSRLGTPQQIANEMEKARSFVFTTLATRETDENTCKVMVGQRLGKNDPQGAAIDNDWETIVYPALFDPKRADKTDERKEEGEPICKERRSKQGWEALRIMLGTIAAMAQIDMNPTPPGGNLIKLPYLSNRYKILPAELQQAIKNKMPGPGQQWVSAWDFTFLGKETSDWVVGQVWCYYRALFWLIHQVRAHAGFTDSKQMVLDLVRGNPHVLTHWFEAGANAAAIEDDMKSSIPGMEVVPHGGGCLARTQSVEGLWKAGNVMLPEDAEWMYNKEGFINEHLDYTGLPTDTNDQVSASSLGILNLAVDIDYEFVAAMQGAKDEHGMIAIL